MAFNGSGVFQRIYNWANDKAANIKVRADRMDVEMDGFATGLSTCITKDGQTTVTANLPMAGFRHTGVGLGTDRAHYTTVGQTQDGKLNWVVAGGTVDAITAAYSPAVATLVDGQLCYIRTTGTNVSTAPTFSPNGLTARTIVKNSGAALLAGDLPLEAVLRYNLANTRWELMNPVTASVVDGSVTAAKLASDAVTTVKILDSNVTTAKIANDAVTTAKILNDNVTYAKIQNVSATDRLLGRSTAGAGDIEEITCTSFARTLLDDADAATARATLGVTTGLTLATPVAATSGTSVSVTGIPSGVNFVVVTLNGVSTNGTSRPQLQIGDSGGLEASGYVAYGGYSTAGSSSTSGFPISDTYAAADLMFGTFTLTRYSGDQWGCTWNVVLSSSNKFTTGAGMKTLSATLDRVGITTVGGADTFDAGAITVAYL